MATTIDSHGDVSEVPWAPPAPEVLDNYATLRAERDWSWDQVADTVASQDEPLAEYLRAHGPEHDSAPAEAAPVEPAPVQATPGQ